MPKRVIFSYSQKVIFSSYTYPPYRDTSEINLHSTNLPHKSEPIDPRYSITAIKNVPKWLPVYYLYLLKKGGAPHPFLSPRNSPPFRWDAEEEEEEEKERERFSSQRTTSRYFFFFFILPRRWLSTESKGGEAGSRGEPVVAKEEEEEDEKKKMDGIWIASRTRLGISLVDSPINRSRTLAVLSTVLPFRRSDLRVVLSVHVCESSDSFSHGRPRSPTEAILLPDRDTGNCRSDYSRVTRVLSGRG